MLHREVDLKEDQWKMCGIGALIILGLFARDMMGISVNKFLFLLIALIPIFFWKLKMLQFLRAFWSLCMLDCRGILFQYFCLLDCFTTQSSISFLLKRRDLFSHYVWLPISPFKTS